MSDWKLSVGEEPISVAHVPSSLEANGAMSHTSLLSYGPACCARPPNRPARTCCVARTTASNVCSELGQVASNRPVRFTTARWPPCCKIPAWTSHRPFQTSTGMTPMAAPPAAEGSAGQGDAHMLLWFALVVHSSHVMGGFHAHGEGRIRCPDKGTTARHGARMCSRTYMGQLQKGTFVQPALMRMFGASLSGGRKAHTKEPHSDANSVCYFVCSRVFSTFAPACSRCVSLTGAGRAGAAWSWRARSTAHPSKAPCFHPL